MSSRRASSVTVASEEDLGKTTVDGELRREHTVVLDGMGPGITLFCQITSTDQSGNATSEPDLPGIRDALRVHAVAEAVSDRRFVLC